MDFDSQMARVFLPFDVPQRDRQDACELPVVLQRHISSLRDKLQTFGLDSVYKNWIGWDQPVKDWFEETNEPSLVSALFSHWENKFWWSAHRKVEPWSTPNEMKVNFTFLKESEQFSGAPQFVRLPWTLRKLVTLSMSSCQMRMDLWFLSLILPRSFQNTWLQMRWKEATAWTSLDMLLMERFYLSH